MMMLHHKKEIEKSIRELYFNLDKINYKLTLYDVIESQIERTNIKNLGRGNNANLLVHKKLRYKVAVTLYFDGEEGKKWIGLRG